MGLYRCTNPECPQGDFEALGPDVICPECGYAVLELVPVHWVRPHPRREGRLEDRPACGIVNTLIGIPHTTEPSAVSCLRCKAVMEPQPQPAPEDLTSE